MNEESPFRSLLDRTQEEILSLIKEKKGWQKEGVSAGNGDLRMESRVYRDGLRIFRGTRTLPASAEDLVRWTWEGTQEDAQQADGYVKEFRTAHTWPTHPDHRIDYALLNLPWPVWNREVAYAMKRVALSSSEWLVVAHSVPEKEWATLRPRGPPKTILMEVGPHRSRVTRVIFGDPKGALPTALTNRMGGNQVAGLLQFLYDKTTTAARDTTSHDSLRSRL